MTTKQAEGKRYSRFWRLASVMVLVPVVTALIRNVWAGRENIPAKGGVILAPNHVSYADTFTNALFFYRCRRYPTFMIKSSLFTMKGVGGILRRAGQLPVDRGAADAALVLREAERMLDEGAAVVIYPEGTVTRDPELWPMVARTGVARLALAAGVPVIPVAHWGTHDILPYGSTKPRLFPRPKGADGRRAAGGPVGVDGPAAVSGGAARGHREDHGGGHRAGRGTARRDAARRPLRPQTRRPTPTAGRRPTARSRRPRRTRPSARTSATGS